MKNVVVWIGKEEARIFSLEGGAVAQVVVHSAEKHGHRHVHEHDLRTRNHPDDEHRYFHDVATALKGDSQVLVVGPSTTKMRFFRYAHQHERELEPRIVGIETMDHPTDAQIVAHLRDYFQESAPRVLP